MLTEKLWEWRRGSISVVSSYTGHMQCLACGAEWWANIRPQSGGRYYRGSWTCHSCGANTKTKFDPTALGGAGMEEEREPPIPGKPEK